MSSTLKKLLILAAFVCTTAAFAGTKSITVTLPAFGGANKYTLSVSGKGATVNKNKVVVKAGQKYTFTYSAIAGSGWKVTAPKPNPSSVTVTIPADKGITSYTVGYVEFQQKKGAETSVGADVTVTVK